MLVSAFAGHEYTMRAYAYQDATSQSYRFYNYADTMWLDIDSPYSYVAPV